MIANNERRLQKLREQQALEGRSIDPKILIEIEDIEEKIAELKTELRVLENDDINKKSPGDLKPKQLVLIYLHGDFPGLTTERRTAIVDALAALMGTSPQAIEVHSVSSGSIVFDLSVPSDAVQRLRFRLHSNSEQLHLLKVEKVILEIESGEIEQWVIKEGKFDLVIPPHSTISSGVLGKPQEDFPIYSKDIWDYLPDMPYMPSRRDRDDLVKNAEADPSKMKRIRLWDYFFRIRPDDVAKPQKQELAELQGKIVQIQQEVSDLTKKLEKEHDRSTNKREKLETELQQYERRMQFLKTEISNLLAQIPMLVSDEEVETWLKEDIKELTETAIVRSGLRDSLITILVSDEEEETWLKEVINPFCILGPAELQVDELIPIFYRDPGSDRHKHLRARRFVVMPDASFVDFYGVYNVELILVGDDVLATYGTLYDFISGRQSGERTTSQHYTDVVQIRSLKDYREIEIDSSEKIFIDNIPSLTLSFMNGDKIDIIFPDEEYFKRADNIIKVIRHKVDLAK